MRRGLGPAGAPPGYCGRMACEEAPPYGRADLVASAGISASRLYLRSSHKTDKIIYKFQVTTAENQ